MRNSMMTYLDRVFVPVALDMLFGKEMMLVTLYINRDPVKMETCLCLVQMEQLNVFKATVPKGYLRSKMEEIHNVLRLETKHLVKRGLRLESMALHWMQVSTFL